MTIVLHVLSWVTAGAIVAIGVLAVRDYHRSRDRPHAALAAALGLLALVVVAGRVQALSGYQLRFVANISLIAFAGCGYALLEYRATIVPLGRWVRVATLGAFGWLSAVVVISRPPLGPGAHLTGGQRLAISALIVLWSLCVLEPATRFLIASRRKTPIDRTRLRLLAIAYSGIAGVLLLAVAIGEALQDHPGLRLGLSVSGLFLTPLMYAGVSPPGWLRRRWIARESGRLARSLLPVGSWYRDMSANLIAWSDETYRLFGLTPGSVRPTYEMFLAAVHPDDRERVRSLIDTSERTLEPYEHDYRVVGPEGTVRWVHSRGEVVVDPATHQPAAMFGVVQDVTGRKLADEAVQASENRLAEAQRLAHLGSFAWDASTDTVTWSAELFRICGLDPADGTPHAEALAAFVHPDDREMVSEALNLALQRCEPFSYEGRIVRPDGEVRWLAVRGRIVAGPSGEALEVHGSAQDITDRKDAELALRRSEEHFRQLVESGPEAVMVVDESGRIVQVNLETSRLLGYGADELVGQPVEVLIEEATRQVHAEHRAKFLHDPSRRPMAAGRDLTARRKDGTRVSVDISLAPINTDDGILVVASVRDVTERRRAEQALLAAYEREKEITERLRAVDRMKDAFLEAVSHELRTPLSVVLGLGVTLEREDLELTRDQSRYYAGRLVVNARRLERLLSDLLDLDRLSRGVLEPQRRPTAVDELARQVAAEVDVGRRPFQINVEPVIANVSRSQVERIVENLLINAVRHTPEETPIWLRVSGQPEGVLIVVEDAGEGVPDDTKTQIFEPFQRGDTPASRARGTGIGLSLVAQFAQLHGGRAWVEDRIGGGARFCVSLPNQTDSTGLEISGRARETQPIR